MKAIIIQDHDARALLDKLKLAQIRTDHPFMLREGMTGDEVVSAVHGTFHFIVCRWLQEQGADVVGR